MSRTVEHLISWEGRDLGRHDPEFDTEYFVGAITADERRVQYHRDVVAFVREAA